METKKYRWEWIFQSLLSVIGGKTKTSALEPLTTNT